MNRPRPVLISPACCSAAAATVSLPPNAEAQQAWQRQWNTLAERVERIAAEDESAGRDYSAGDKLHRAALYRFVAERMMSHRDPERLVVYRPLYGDGGLWVRPVAMFLETVEHDGRTVPRFAPVNE